MFIMVPSTKIEQSVQLTTRAKTEISLNDHIIVPHDVLYLNYTNGSTPLNKGAARALDKKCL